SLPGKDREKLDSDLAKELERLGKYYQKAPFIHKRISRQFLLRKADWTKEFSSYYQQTMPRTKKMLDKYAESHDQYCVRPLLWAERTFRESDIIPSEFQLLKKACLYSSRHNDIVKDTVAEILARFNTKKLTVS